MLQRKTRVVKINQLLINKMIMNDTMGFRDFIRRQKLMNHLE